MHRRILTCKTVGGDERVEGPRKEDWRWWAEQTAKLGHEAFNEANSIPANYISIPVRDRCSKHARQRPTEFLPD